MRKLLLAAALLVVATSAFAADLATLPVKATPRANPLVFPYTGSGIYWGVATKMGVEQDSASANILGVALATGTVNASGAGIGGTLGYMHGMGNMWVAVEGNVYYQNVTGSGQAATAPVGGVSMSVPATFASRWSADQVVKVGGWNPLSILTNFGITFPTLPAPPSLPNITVLPNGHTYLMAGVEEWGIDGQFFTAGGTTMGIAALVGTGIMSQVQDQSGKLTGAVLDVGAQVVFADKGLEITNAFGAGGPPVLSTSSWGRKYEGYAKVLF